MVGAWQTAVRDAWALAYGERWNELHDERRARLLDERGLHPYSVAWGAILWFEGQPGVVIADGTNRTLKLGEGDDGYVYIAGKHTPHDLREGARVQAINDFVAEIFARAALDTTTEGGDDGRN